MLKYKRYSFLLYALITVSCGQAVPELSGVDTSIWRKDKNGCGALRSGMGEAMEKEKDNLKRLTEMQVIALLGRPDENMLLTRNQKFYHYYINAGPHCDSTIHYAKKLVLRFNAMGIVKETLIE